MATSVANLNPSAPIILIYIQDIGKILALPQGAAETAPMPFFGPEFIKTWFGKKGSKCFATPIGPIPGPPPPCGIQKVLCKFI